MSVPQDRPVMLVLLARKDQLVLKVIKAISDQPGLLVLPVRRVT